MVARSLIALILIVAFGVYARALEGGRAVSERLPDFSGVPTGFGEWRSRNVPVTPEVEAILGADAYLFREYRRRDGASASLFIGYFADQEVGAQIHSPKNCLPGAGWGIHSIRGVSLPVPGGEQHAQRMVIQRQDRRQDVLYWFRTRGGTVTGEYALKWDLVKNSLARRPTDAAFVRIIVPDGDDPSVTEFLSAVYPAVRGALGEVGLP